MVVEFGAAVLMEREAKAVGAQGFRLVSVGVGGVTPDVRPVHLRQQGSAVDKVGLGESGEITKGGEEVDGFNDGLRFFTGVFHAGSGDDQGRTQGFFKEAVFTVDGVFAEVPSVIAPEHDDGVLVGAGFLELGEDFTHVVVDVADAGGVVAAHFIGVGGIFPGIPAVVVVLIGELT